jgi:hypothetical protein
MTSIQATGKREKRGKKGNQRKLKEMNITALVSSN